MKMEDVAVGMKVSYTPGGRTPKTTKFTGTVEAKDQTFVTVKADHDGTSRRLRPGSMDRA